MRGNRRDTWRVIMKLHTLLLTTALMVPAAAFADQDVEKIGPDFETVKGATQDAKHTPKIKAPKTVRAGEWFPVTISIGHKKQHPSWVEHHVRWISLEADGVEINRAYLHPVMSKPEVTFYIALPDKREFDKDGEVTKRMDKVVTLRAVEAPTHASHFFSEVKVKVKKKKMKK